jgi:GPH family glycoside/pentoside/hexuronide:cation symporter
MKDKNQKLPIWTKLLYGAGDFGFSMTDTIIGVLFAIFLTDVVRLEPLYASIAWFVGKSVDYINDPLIGYLSDKTRSRWGRRRPFLLFGFLPFGLAFAMLWWRPPIESQIGLAIYYALAFAVYDTAATFVYMPYFALTPELTQDYDERTALTSYRMAFSIVAGLIGFTLPLMIIGQRTPQNANRVFMMGLIFGAASALPLLLTFFGTRERREYQEQAIPSVRESLRAARRNRPFLFAMGIFLFTWAGVNVVQSMLLYYITYHLGLTGTTGDLIPGVVFLAALLALPLWEWTSRHLDKRKAYMMGIAFLAAVLLGLTFLNPGASVAIVMVLAALAGIGVGAVHVLPWSMIPDAVEWDELATGERHEGVFYSLVTLFRKVATSIAIPLSLLILEISGYSADLPAQPPSAHRAILALTGPIPGLFLVGGILFAFFYPLSREAHAEARARIQARKAKASG